MVSLPRTVDLSPLRAPAISGAEPGASAFTARRPTDDWLEQAATALLAGDGNAATRFGQFRPFEAGLSPVQRGEFARYLDDTGLTHGLNFGAASQATLVAGPVSAAAGVAARVPPSTAKVLTNLAQLALDLAGIIDPTPTSDILSGLISVATGDWRGALVSAGSAAAPYAGDALKATRVGKWLKTISETVELAATNPAFKRAVAPALKAISDLIGKLPARRVSNEIDTALKSAKRQIDDVLGLGTKLAGKVASITRRVGRNEATWKLGADGRPIEAAATIREVFVKAPRSQAEQRVAGAVGKSGHTADEGGHILGHRFFKDQGIKNLFPQNGNFNVSAYKRLENEIAEFAKAGAVVRVNIKLVGGGARNGGRPDVLRVTYTATNPKTGKTIHTISTTFDNDPSAVYNRLTTAQIRALVAK